MKGIMYRDDDKAKSFVAKVSNVITAYTEKMQRDPKVILVNEADYDAAGRPKFVNVAVRPDHYVWANHFWAGEE